MLGTVIVLSTSCSKDDDPKLTDSESKLIGTWTISENNTMFEVFVGEQTLIDYAVSEGDYTQEEAEDLYDLYQAFLMDDFEISGTIEFRTDHTYLAVFPPDDADVGSWKLSSDGKELTLDEGDPIDEEVITINSLSSNSMNITIKQTEFEDFDEDADTPDVEITIEITISLTK